MDRNDTLFRSCGTIESMDGLDASILLRLEEDYTTPRIQISRSLGIARSTLKRRIECLFRDGIFEGYQVEINRFALGLERLVYLEVKTNPRERWLLEALESLDRCVESHGVIGEYGLVFKLMFRNVGELVAGLDTVDSTIASSSSKRYRITDAIETYKERALPPTVMEERELDDLDRLLLGELSNQNSPFPLPLWRIAKRLERESKRQVSPSAIQKRIRRMVHGGVIRQFTLRPRRWVREEGIRALVRFKTDPGSTRRIAVGIASRREVLSLYRTGEDYGLLGEIFVPSLEGVDRFLKVTYADPAVIDTMTTIVVERRKELSVPSHTLMA